MVNFWAGPLKNERYLISLDSLVDRIRFSLTEPPDFSKLLDSKAEIRGTVISERILEDLTVRHNDEVAWQVPQGIGIRGFAV